MLLLVALALQLALLCHSSRMSTFRTESLQINSPDPKECEGILDEALYLMRNHFIKRHMYSAEEWALLREEYARYTDSQLAVKHFMERFGDPYSRFIPKKAMLRRQQSIRGHSVGLGLELSRRTHLAELASAARQLLPQVADLSLLPMGLSREQQQQPVQASTATCSTQEVAYSPVESLYAGTLQRCISKFRFLADTLTPVAVAAACWPKRGLAQRGAIAVATLAVSTACAARWLWPLVTFIEAADDSDSGLHAGDRVVAVDGACVLGRSVRAVTELLDEGNQGEPVRIGLSRQGPSGRHYVELTLLREQLPMVRTTASLLRSCGLGVGYLAVSEFSDQTLEEVRTAMRQLRKEMRASQGSRLRGIVIDLRGNPGGPLASALDLAALFLPRGSVLTTMGAQGGEERHRSTNLLPDKRTALLLLCDENTASASEIFIAAMRDNRRATVMGQRTVGKNIAQAMTTLSDGSGLAFTVREYSSPQGLSMAQGILPEIEVLGGLDIADIEYDLTGPQWRIRGLRYRGVHNRTD